MAAIDSRVRQVIAAALAALILGAWGCHRSEPAVQSTGVRPAAVILISDRPAEFEPDVITIKVGETVEWHNTGGISHSVEFLSSDGPQAVALSASHLMTPDGSYRRTFTSPGTYIYGCRFHIINGMLGKVIVRQR